MTAGIIGAALLLAAGTQDGGMAGMKMVPAQNGAPAPACPATPAPPPAEFAGFAMTPLAAGASAAAAPELPLGSGARLALGAVAATRFAVAPGHAPAPGSHAGLVELRITAAGRYRVALGAGAWIDLVNGNVPLRSAAHSHGPACSPVKKMVDFDLTPGNYLLQLSGTDQPTVAVMVLPVVAAPAIAP